MFLAYKSNKKENLRLLLFFMIVIITQGIRTNLNNAINSSIFNYQVISIILIIYITFRENRINKINWIVVNALLLLNIIFFIFGQYDKGTFFRGMLTFMLPIYILVLDYKNIEMQYVLKNAIKLFNLIIYISFFYSIVEIIIDRANIENRLSGIIGHSLTAAWYYVVFISLNAIYCKYFKRKKDIFIIKDIFIGLIGIVLTTGRIGIFMGIMVSMTYIFSCLKNRTNKYIIMPLIVFGFIFTPIFQQLIWSKFEFALGFGDITNGRLLGIREMIFWNIYPNIFIGKGIGYSNYITQYLFNTSNFENPILMFAFDYGCITTLIVILITLIIPTVKLIKEKNIFMLINFLCVCIIPYTYNGIAESTGLFIILLYITYFYMMIISYLKVKNQVVN